jgi:glycosyltransferase involved in cell wall biosynthesis
MHLSGMGRYMLNLLKGISQADPEFRIVVFVSQMSDISNGTAASPSFEFIEVKRSPRALRDQIALPRTIRRLGLDLLHSLDSFSPLAGPCPRIMTIYDLIPLTCRQMLLASTKARFAPFWKAWLKIQCRKAAAIITLSKHSAADIQRLLKVPEDKVHIIPASVDTPPQQENANDVRAKYGVNGRIALYVGRRDPYKNIVGLIQAFALVKAAAKESVSLVIVGPPDPRVPEPEREVERLNLNSSVTFTGHISDNDVRAFYRAADVFLFPSLYEGFGLPPLEAMSFGAPIVAGNRTSLPEVLDGAAILVDPTDTQAIADAALKVLSDRDLAAKLRDLGRERAALFSLKKLGEATLRLYEEVLKKQ